MESRCHICGRKRPVYVEMEVGGLTKSICEECYKRELAVPRQPMPGEGTCPNCDAVVRDDDNFCHACGSPLRRECQNCGNAMGPEDRFCSRCGTPWS